MCGAKTTIRAFLTREGSCSLLVWLRVAVFAARTHRVRRIAGLGSVSAKDRAGEAHPRDKQT